MDGLIRELDEALRVAWAYELRLVPVLSAILITESIMWIRHLLRVPYSPIYVTFLLGNLNKDLSLYFGEDVAGVGKDLSDKAAVGVRYRLMVNALISALMSAWLTPYIAGGLIAAFLPLPVFVQYLGVVTAYRLWRLILGYRHFGEHAIATKAAKKLLAVTYLLYLALVTRLTYDAYIWVRAFAETGRWLEMFNQLTRAVFSTGLAYALVIGVLSTVFATLITTPKLRKEQLEHIQRLSRQEHVEMESPPEEESQGQ